MMRVIGLTRVVTKLTRRMPELRARPENSSTRSVAYLSKREDGPRLLSRRAAVSASAALASGLGRADWECCLVRHSIGRNRDDSDARGGLRAGRRDREDRREPLFRPRFRRVEAAMCPMVEQAQNVSRIGPKLMNPYSQLGIHLLHGVLHLVSLPGLRAASAKLMDRKLEEPDLSDDCIG